MDPKWLRGNLLSREKKNQKGKYNRNVWLND